jgi:hypothetical protein
MKIEYRVVPVTRFHVTRYHESDNSSGVEGKGEFSNYTNAFDVAYALCKQEHDASGEPVGSLSFIYPENAAYGKPVSA